MSKLNKLVTNYPVELTEEEISNLSGTLAPVIAACGGGGGGTGGKIYTGIGFVSVNNTTNQIGLTNEANTKLNQDIPTKVSDLTDSANYQTIAGMDEYLTTATYEADSATFLTQTSASQNLAPISVTADVETLKAASGDFSEYYQKTETSSKSQLSAKFNQYAKQADLITTISLVNGKQDELEFTYDNSGSIIKINNSAIAGGAGGSVSYTGRNGVEINGNYIELETTAKNAIDSVGGISTDVGTLKTASAGWDKVSDKLDTTAFSTVSGSFLTAHQSLDDYATKTDINDMATQTWVDEQGFYTKASGDNDYAPKSVTGTVNTLTGASAGWNEVTAKLDKSIYSNASGNWEASYNVLTSYSAAGTWLTSHQSLTNYYTKSETSGATQLSTEFGKYLTTSQYNTDSATFALKTDLNDLVSSASVTTNDNYVMTNTGWKVLTLPGGGMTQVYHDTTLTGDGNANDNKLGVVWSALSGNTIDSAKSAYFATKAKYGEQREYEIGSEIYGLTYFRTNIINWTNLISGNSGIDVLDLDEDGYPETFQLTQTAYNAVTSVSSKLDTTAFSTVSGTFLTKSSADNDYAPISITSTVNTLTAASAGWNNKVDKPTSLNDKYLVLRTDSNGAVSGWCDFQDQSYSKTEALGTFVATANIDTTTLSGDGKSVSTKLGVKTDVIATIDYVSGNYLPLSGGTVSGDVIVSSSGTCLLTVGTEATLMGQSRVVNMGDTTARGTNWLGVSQSNQGFLKYVNGGNVGALNGTSIQINFAPDGANSYGNITVNSQDNMSKVVHVPTASYNSMSSFDDTNGPNYMLRKTASGFDIGAAVINVTALPQQTEANAYYFVYDL